MSLAISQWLALARGIFRNDTRRWRHYRFIRRLGGGGMTEVYLAHHRPTDSVAVVKTLPWRHANLVTQSRFEREAHLLAMVASAQTVQVLERGAGRRGSRYFAMEYARGLNLFDWVTRYGCMGDGRAIALLSQVAGCLATVHARGVLHCDVAPKNVMLCSTSGDQDAVKMIDFGLARTRPVDESPVSDWIDTGKRDSTGYHDSGGEAIRGTPAFMSPEACRPGAEYTAQSDIYSLGCLAFFLLSGQLPFAGSTAIEICWKQIHEAPPRFSDRMADPVSSELQRLIAGCLAKQPGDRPSTMNAILAQLEACQAYAAWSPDDSARWWRQHGTSAATDCQSEVPCDQE